VKMYFLFVHAREGGCLHGSICQCQSYRINEPTGQPCLLDQCLSLIFVRLEYASTGCIICSCVCDFVRSEALPPGCSAWLVNLVSEPLDGVVSLMFAVTLANHSVLSTARIHKFPKFGKPYATTAPVEDDVHNLGLLEGRSKEKPPVHSAHVTGARYRPRCRVGEW
jgi:hypothetical protein